MWTKGNYRRVFLDMHIADWNEEFLSRLDPEHIVKIMKEAGVQMLVVKGRPHTGLALFPTKNGRMHNGLKGRDYVKEMSVLCHKNGIAVQTYFSQIFDNWAYENHPEWRMINREGFCSLDNAEYDSNSMFKRGRYGLVCPNNEEYRNYVKACLTELTEHYEFESIFLDMPFWPDVCYCPACRKKYFDITGKELPRKVDWSDPDFIKWQALREEWMADFANFSTNCVKKIKPQVTIEHNLSTIVNSWALGATELLADACDYAGGDLYGGYLEESFVCKYYRNISKTLPFEYITSRCDPGLRYHTTSKSEEELTLYSMIALLHNGAISVCDGMNPDGTIVDDFYQEILKQVFRNVKRYEKYVSGELITDAAIWFASRSKYSLSENGNQVTSELCSTDYIKNDLAVARILRQEHISFDVVPSQKMNHIPGKLLIVSDVARINDEEMKYMESHLQKGGNIYISGHIGNPRMYQLLGASYEGMTAEDVTYICPTPAGSELLKGFNAVSPMNVQRKMEILSFTGEFETLATITLPYTMTGTKEFSAIHSNPPGKNTTMPAIVKKKVGKGTILWVAAPIENSKPSMSKSAVGKILRSLIETPAFTSNAPSCVEILQWEKDGKTYLAAINEQKESPFIPVHEMQIEVPYEVEAAIAIEQNKNLPISWDGRTTTIQLPKLEIVQVIELHRKTEDRMYE